MSLGLRILPEEMKEVAEERSVWTVAPRTRTVDEVFLP